MASNTLERNICSMAWGKQKKQRKICTVSRVMLERCGITITSFPTTLSLPHSASSITPTPLLFLPSTLPALDHLHQLFPLPWSTPSFTSSSCLNTFSMRLTLTTLYNIAMYWSLVFLILLSLLYFLFFS